MPAQMTPISSGPTPESFDIAPVSEIIAELRAGRVVILVDEEDRENEGDLVMAAEFVTPEAINFMVTHGRGLVCLTLTEERCAQLKLPLMASRNGHATAPISRNLSKRGRVSKQVFSPLTGLARFKWPWRVTPNQQIWCNRVISFRCGPYQEGSWYGPDTPRRVRSDRHGGFDACGGHLRNFKARWHYGALS